MLLMFLSGPGESGKSEVMKAVLGYASTFCKNVGIAFTRRTIISTALTGVAVTSINGDETIHSAAHLNAVHFREGFQEDDIDAFRLMAIMSGAPMHLMSNP